MGMKAPLQEAASGAPAATEATLEAIRVELLQKTEPADTQQVDVTDEAARDLGKVDIASLDQYTPVAGRLPVDPSGVTSPVSIAGTVQVDVTDEAARDLGKVDIASLDQYTPVAGRLPVDGSGVTQPISGTVTANPTTSFGKTITRVSVSQGAAGTTVARYLAKRS